jgi:hypothetical protein
MELNRGTMDMFKKIKDQRRKKEEETNRLHHTTMRHIVVR